MALAAEGWRIIGVGRDAGRCEKAAAAIRAASASGGVSMLRADLSLLRDARRLAGEIAGLTDRIDLLVNNAGGIAAERVVTAEGNEATFAANHLGPFVLTDRLLPILRETARGGPPGQVRVIVTSSDASEMLPGMKWDDLQHLNDFNAGLAYANAKLANCLFASGLAVRTAEDGIVVHAFHPGPVATNFANTADDQTRGYILSLDLLTSAQGADTLIWLATADAPGGATDGYFYERRPRARNPVVESREAVDRLWRMSEAITAA